MASGKATLTTGGALFSGGQKKRLALLLAESICGAMFSYARVERIYNSHPIALCGQKVNKAELVGK